MNILYEDNLQSVPCEKRAEILLNRPESQWFERKGIKIRPVDIARPIIGWSVNTFLDNYFRKRSAIGCASFTFYH